VHGAPLVLRIAVVVLGLVSVVLQTRRFAAKRGGAKAFRVVAVSLVITGGLVGWVIYQRLHQLPRRSRSSDATAIPAPVN
jgi:hypothetical protein